MRFARYLCYISNSEEYLWLNPFTARVLDGLWCEYNFRVCGQNPMLWPLKWKLSACTFTQCYFFFRISQKEIWKFGQNLLLAKFCSKDIIDQKQQHPRDIDPFSTSYKPVHSVMSKFDEETNKKKQNKKTTSSISPTLHQLQLFITYLRVGTNHEPVAFPYLSREQFSDTRD